MSCAQEVSARRKAQLDSPLGALVSGSESESEASSEGQGSAGRERVPDLRLGLASGYLRRDQDQGPEEQGGPTNSQWGRRWACHRGAQPDMHSNPPKIEE